MSSSIHRRESDATQPLALRDPAAEDDGEDINSVPRRFMRGKHHDIILVSFLTLWIYSQSPIHVR